MNLNQLRQLQSRTFEIKADSEKWEVIIDEKLQFTRLHFAIMINDTTIKVLSKYLIESLKYSGLYICVFRQSRNDNKKFLVRFIINTDTNTILILRLKRDINKSYTFNRAKNFYYDTNIYLEDFTKRATEIKVQIEQARMPVKNKEINTSGLRIVKKANQLENKDPVKTLEILRNKRKDS